jgi:thymidine phosphorylase
MSFDLSQNNFNKENLNLYLKELAKVFKKLNGNKMMAEIVLVGGASVLSAYNFRKSTQDIDAVIKSSSVMKDAVGIISDKYNLPADWLNNDFEKSKSYSSKLREISKYYKTFSGVLEIRIVDSEYLIAMKLMAGRRYKYDLSDIVGVFYEHEKKGNPIKKEDVDIAVKTLYGSWDNIPIVSKDIIEAVFKCNNYEELFEKVRKEEIEVDSEINEFNKKNPKKINRDNINDFIEKLLEKK